MNYYKHIPLTMYIQNRRNSSKFSGCSPLQNCIGLTSLKPAIAYFAYTKRSEQVYDTLKTKNGTTSEKYK